MDEPIARTRTVPPPAGTWTDLPPAAGAVVMATGILSVGLHLDGSEVLSRVLLCLAALVWLLLGWDFGARLLRSRRRWLADADTPPGLTAVAATTIMGVRVALLGWSAFAGVLLALAVVLWAVLLTAVLRHLRRHMPGAVFLICVATQALAVLAATLAPVGGDWLAWAGLVAFGLGLLLYVDALARFDFGQIARGAGDQWVAGGALAISALATSKLLASAVWSGSASTALRTATLVLLALDLVWYVVLLCSELLRPRLRYDVRRWATVFPLGMTAVASLSASAATGIAWLGTLGSVLLWVAALAWLLTLCGLLRALVARAVPPLGQ
ncbi:tellurite resistance/C4-dicarboxylate transporter family protein [Streptomyces sp. NBC_01353]|uniref:tellurite resistance/C4-dicarboxylate transporter family protein n=1 Tax=Streptomyces sp. NBC_01353 TaxID=2903835 RepID=UPI002E34141C|nr:tellurite resistance/C4-dicarboxylate transporter family protein [Streptomyces sp. NBC_01353]